MDKKLGKHLEGVCKFWDSFTFGVLYFGTAIMLIMTPFLRRNGFGRAMMKTGSFLGFSGVVIDLIKVNYAYKRYGTELAEITYRYNVKFVNPFD
jgi:hypothetical protein